MYNDYRNSNLNMEKKYKLTDETISVNGRTLYRIEALKDFGDVKKGDKGGYVEKEENLSQSGGCWVYRDAAVYGSAKVYGDAEVYDDAAVYGDAQVYGDARVYGDASVHGDARVCDHARVYDNARVRDNAWVCGYAKVCDNAIVRDKAEISDNAEVSGNAEVSDNAKVYECAWIYDKVHVCDNAVVCDDAEVFGNARICGDATIASSSDYIVFKNWWSSGRYFTWTRSNDMWKVGCFYGTGKELIKKAYKDSKSSGEEYERIVRYVDSIKKKTAMIWNF